MDPADRRAAEDPMEKSVLDNVQASLRQKEDSLRRWMSEASPEEKALMLGSASEADVTSHLAVVDDSLDCCETGSLGRCTVCHDYIEPGLLMVDYTASVCLSHLSGEEADRLEHELELAQTVQKALLPSRSPEIPGLEIAAFSRPAQILGGDYFDFIPFASGDYGLLLGDVAGHGVSASLHMASLQGLSRAIVSTSRSPAEVLTQIHRQFIHNIRYTTFVTLFLAAYDAGTKSLAYANAGHNPPLILSSESAPQPVRWLHPTGAAIGLVEDGGYTERRLTLTRGDVVVLYTDGVVEASGAANELYGADRLVEIVASLRKESAQDIVRGVTRNLEDFVASRPLADDATLVVGKVG
jgi:serine phosphatase RsbU (regulator of sigma subunit)